MFLFKWLFNLKSCDINQYLNIITDNFQKTDFKFKVYLMIIINYNRLVPTYNAQLHNNFVFTIYLPSSYLHNLN